MSEPTTHTVNAPGATIYYDVREAEGQNGAPPLMMIASPMDAGAFATLVGHFPDRTVVTYDPAAPREASGPTAPSRRPLKSTRTTCTA